jgi:hypothetical protein
MRTFRETIGCIFLLAISAAASNYAVKAGGGGNYTTIQACASAMSAGDTCTVYAGTYNENVTVSAGTAGNYKTITVNGSDVVTVLGFTLNSHTKLIGNCTAPAAINTCGFNIQNTSSPNSACVSLPNNTTDVYIRNNVLYACGAIGPGWSTSTSYIYIQGNTESYTCTTSALVPSTKTCNGLNLYGNHYLVEGNDFSHYTLALNWNPSYSIARNNTFHDQFETEAGGNGHTDTWFSDPGGTNLVNNEYNVYEGNYQRNGVGPNSKGPLLQAPSCSGCAYAIVRFNATNRIGSGSTTNDQNWISVKVYNNTTADPNSAAGSTGLESDNSTDSNPPNPSFLNQIYFYSRSGIATINPYACGNSNNCNYGHNLYWCSGGCTDVYGHVYGSGSFLSDPGNQNANPMFVNYVSPGNASNDYHLQAGSPAIAAGTHLTTVASGDSGSGTSLVVNDASYFQDGYGLSNPYSTVQGDCIAVTTVTNHVCVTSVNYATNTLTLASSITRSSGDSVWLYSKSDGVQVLTGSAPDLGAHPYGAGGTPPAPPSGLSAVVN